MIVSVFKTKIVCCVHKSNIAKEGKKKKQKKNRQRIIMHSPDRSALVVIATWNNPLDRVEFLNLGRLELSHTHRILFSWNLKFNHNSISRGFCLLWFFFHQKAEIESIPLLLVHATHSKPNNFEHPYLFPNTYIVHHTFFYTIIVLCYYCS